jgi:ubiquinone/menaquinone biosynthesis C-methylase UbiE
MNYTISEANLARQRLLADVLAPLTTSLLDQIRLPRGSKCLDIGCGVGETTLLLAEKLEGVTHIIGIDQDPALLNIARQNPSSTRASVTFEQGDARQWP